MIRAATTLAGAALILSGCMARAPACTPLRFGAAPVGTELDAAAKARLGRCERPEQGDCRIRAADGVVYLFYGDRLVDLSVAGAGARAIAGGPIAIDAATAARLSRRTCSPFRLIGTGDDMRIVGPAADAPDSDTVTVVTMDADAGPVIAITAIDGL